VLKLPERMLSTQKVYSIAEIEKWSDNVVKVGRNLGVTDFQFKITPKLDGFAAYDDGKILYTRGDGRNGTDITRALDRGMLVSGKKRGQGPGEIVVDKNFFKLELSDKYENSRNIISGVIKEGELDKAIALTVKVGAVCFQPFSGLNSVVRNKDELIEDINFIWDDILQGCPFDTDGLIIEVTNEQIKDVMGSTNHHHRWQVAYKRNTEFHDIRVIEVKPQTAKTGRITPVAILEPTKVSGVTISRATCHHYGNVVSKGIGPGAIVEVCRSGLVIPKIESVIKSVEVDLPQECPSCGAPTEMDGDDLLCTNTETCPAQIERTIGYFFETLGNCDGFGPKIIESICAHAQFKDVRVTICDFYSDVMLYVTGQLFGSKTASNLLNELTASRRRPIEDWRFLAAFSIHNIGKGGCEKLLKHHRLAEVFDLTVEDIIKIDGFAEKSANSLVRSLANIKYQFDQLMEMGFNLIESPLASELNVASPIAGKTIVFTGTMVKGSRDDMEKHAKALGAKVSGSVSRNTDYLVCGSNVGAKKIESAENNNVVVISEDDYLKTLVA